ncbi:multiple sugar transport system substrate-binding protein [Streptomyces sp. B3I7]|jgi:multiple sugar transport system substrate-binding protein|uniref:ABC transporter substrate-binding protein n=1 Tax=unclassified Streptomyces TaxID=2593676 RepID=UPI002780368A|nr:MULTISPECIES: ABC transporter substrate-binding protein [unclassified Streptomyces]MDQ0785693.1 multiple sugar transport system substrate-binding protein [Streptomyces sp. B3I8]MDQ0814708.1 multiple sugar transport system substrate-binding protein [Streptomyces sp. B3I7]
MRARRVAGVAGVLSATLVLAGCGSGGDGDSAAQGADGRGPITFVTQKDNSGVLPFIADEWNKAHPDEKVTIKQQSDQADQQLSDFEQHFQAKDPGYDVVTVDVVWTAEFAARGWIVPLTGRHALDTDKLLPATVKAGTYNGKLYAAPYGSDGGLLYYRTDLVDSAPTTWNELIGDCKGKTTKGTITGARPACYAGQFAKYEGLTVNAAEAINATGGTIVGPDGRSTTVDSPKSAAGLDFLVNGFKDGYIPKEALGFQETQSVNAFQSGQLMFMRNWPYAVAILNGKGSKVAGKFGVAPLPGPSGHGASTLGGHNLGISAYSRHQATALDFLKFIESDKVQRNNLTVGTLAPVLTSMYSDPKLTRKFTYLPDLLKSIETAVPRPITPFYPGVTEAIETNTYAALQGRTTTAQALKNMQAAIKSATAGG